MRAMRLHLFRCGGLALLALLTGCTLGGDISDLEAYADEVNARPGSGIPALPEFKRTPLYLYQAGELQARDPFVKFYLQQEEESNLASEQINPEWQYELSERSKEELESFELDRLRMVGLIENDSGRWGIIIDPDRVVHRVKVNNYMGQNIGKIVNITEDRIEIRELFQDSQGRWGQREASLSLLEE